MEEKEMTLYLLHAHSLDNNDFYDKQSYEIEINNLKKNHLHHKPFINQPSGKWIGLTGEFTYETQELLHYES